jgi:hypothetical protein
VAYFIVKYIQKACGSPFRTHGQAAKLRANIWVIFAKNIRNLELFIRTDPLLPLHIASMIYVAICKQAWQLPNGNTYPFNRYFCV